MEKLQSVVGRGDMQHDLECQEVFQKLMRHGPG